MSADQPTPASFSLSAHLEPLYDPWEEPNAFRTRSDKPGEPALVKRGRRRSGIDIVQNLRDAVREWRESDYPGASDTTRTLLNYWFHRAHRRPGPDGAETVFRYYYCQREAIETFIYLKEVRGIDTLSGLIGEFGNHVSKHTEALGVTDQEDAWSRYAFKLATGTGKTKVMTLAIVWSYFHALRESGSPMAKHFVVIAPGLTVFERLKLDFVEEDIFRKDPLIPPEWTGDWNMSVVLQSEASGAATGGVIYLTNIDRLYDPKKRKRSRNDDTYDWLGPAVSKASALDTGEHLRQRITQHRRLMVLNDEAHHIWDPDLAWARAIEFLNDQIHQKYGEQLVAQLDFTATPKDNKGQLFKHVVCDTPLGEAVDAGIVKTPIIGRADQKLREEPSENAAYKYDRHLRLGYERWKRSRDEWAEVDKKALLFVMCEDTEAADLITHRLNTDDAFKELHGKTINLHTNLKGKVKKVGRGQAAQYKFVPNEKQISDDDLRTLRKLSRELDSDESPFLCIVSVLMLREGWDVRNVTTIVPLRPYTSKANILPEQTLGRGLRRMTSPGSGASEVVVVVEHNAFVGLYKEELAQEGLLVEDEDVMKIEPTTVTIFPDERKDIRTLEIQVPRLTGGYTINPKLEEITEAEVREAASKYGKLPLAEKVVTDLDYEGRHLFTNEVVERMKLHVPLLDHGYGAVSYYVKQFEQVCKVRNIHAKIAPLLKKYFEEMLFDEPATLFDERLVARLGQDDVAQYVRAVFVPLIRKHTVEEHERHSQAAPMRLSTWRPYKVTHGERKQALPADHTLFNLVPCTQGFEISFKDFLDKATDVAAFAKNEGPQSLRIDYLAQGGRLAFYTPDFFARTRDGRYFLIETKGRVDIDVPLKARAAMAWCTSASTQQIPWRYLYVPNAVFQSHTSQSLMELAGACEPALSGLLEEAGDVGEQLPLLAPVFAEEEAEVFEYTEFLSQEAYESLPNRAKRAVRDSIMLFRFMETKQDMNLAAAFNPLLGPLDTGARAMLKRRLALVMPETVPAQKAWFYTGAEHQVPRDLQRLAQNLKKTLVFNGGYSPIGLLAWCIRYAENQPDGLTGVFMAIRQQFGGEGDLALLQELEAVNEFRNNLVAHQGQELTDSLIAENGLQQWIGLLRLLRGSVV